MYYRYTVLGMYLAGRGEYRRACDAARLGHQRNFEAVTGRLFELGGSLEDDIQGLGAVVRGDSTDGGNDKSDAPSSHEDRMISVGDALAKLLESERQSIREWSVLCDMTEGKDRRTFGLATRVLDEAIESEACLIEFTSFEREGLTRPSGSFRR
jgi:ferritin-like protein